MATTSRTSSSPRDRDSLHTRKITHMPHIKAETPEHPPPYKSHIRGEKIKKCIQCDGNVHKNHMVCIFDAVGWNSFLCAKCCRQCNNDPFGACPEKYCARCDSQIDLTVLSDGSSVCAKCKRKCELCNEYYLKHQMCKISKGCWICNVCVPNAMESMEKHMPNE